MSHRIYNFDLEGDADKLKKLLHKVYPWDDTRTPKEAVGVSMDKLKQYTGARRKIPGDFMQKLEQLAEAKK